MRWSGFENWILFTDNRTYHFQAEDDSDQRAWLSVLVNCKEGALHRAFDNEGGRVGSSSLLDLQQAIISYVQKLPSNDRCCDCNSTNGAYLEDDSVKDEVSKIM